MRWVQEGQTPLGPEAVLVAITEMDDELVALNWDLILALLYLTIYTTSVRERFSYLYCDDVL